MSRLLLAALLLTACRPAQAIDPTWLNAGGGGGQLSTIHPAQFAADAAALSATTKRQLDELAALLAEMPGVRLTLSGHADAREPSPATLSRQRAEAVRDRLIAGGVAEARLTVRGAGADEPIADNETEAGRAKNRRVDLTITAQ